MANCCIKFDIFKDIFFDLMMGNKASNNIFNKFLIKSSSKNITPLDLQLFARFKIIEKKNLKDNYLLASQVS